jgi:ribose-phosphate pyrophosphokinase
MLDFNLIVFPNMREFGEKVDRLLQKKYATDQSFLLEMALERFNNGEAKAVIKGTPREKVYILADVGNWSVTYPFLGAARAMSPDEHFADIKRAVSALGGKAGDITVIMPLLYQSRQDKKTTENESLDCAMALQELQSLGVRRIITFDVHNLGVANAVPTLEFDNVYPGEKMLEALKEQIEEGEVVTVSPDTGAMEKARYFANKLNCDAGVFYKRRDYAKLEKGKNPIVELIYLGEAVVGKTVIVVDDMIASGGSVLEVTKELKEKGAKKVIVVVSFGLFTAGAKKFNQAYENGWINKVLVSNLSFVAEEVRKQEWCEVVECEELVAKLI